MAKATKARSSTSKTKNTAGKTGANGTGFGLSDAKSKGEDKKKATASKGGKDAKATSTERRSILDFGKLREFLRDVRAEMKKVSWPGRKQLFASTSAVLLAILILGIYIGLLDWLFKSISTALNL